MSYMIGQRVVFVDKGCIDVICTITDIEKDKIHINNPFRGYVHWVAPHNVKPLPNGQL